MRSDRLMGIPVVLRPTWLVVFSLLVASLVTSLPGIGPVALPGAAALVVASIVALLFMGCVVVHEMSHALVARRRGMHVPEVRVLDIGPQAWSGRPAASPLTELLVAATGPLLSLAVGVALVGASLALRDEVSGAGLSLHWGCYWLGLANLALAAFQVAPCPPLDGGHIVRAVAAAATRDAVRANHIAGVVGRGFGYTAVGAGLVVTFLGSVLVGLWLVLLGWFTGRLARGAVDRIRMERLTAGLSVADVTVIEVSSIGPNLTLDTLMAQDERDGVPGVYPVVAEGRFIGLVYTVPLRRSRRRRWAERRVVDVMTPLGSLSILRPGDPLIEAVDRLESGRVEALPVVDPEAPAHLVGLVTRERVLERLRARQAIVEARGDKAARCARG